MNEPMTDSSKLAEIKFITNYALSQQDEVKDPNFGRLFKDIMRVLKAPSAESHERMATTFDLVAMMNHITDAVKKNIEGQGTTNDSERWAIDNAIAIMYGAFKYYLREHFVDYYLPEDPVEADDD